MLGLSAFGAGVFERLETAGAVCILTSCQDPGAQNIPRPIAWTQSPKILVAFWRSLPYPDVRCFEALAASLC